MRKKFTICLRFLYQMAVKEVQMQGTDAAGAEPSRTFFLSAQIIDVPPTKRRRASLAAALHIPPWITCDGGRSTTLWPRDRPGLLSPVQE